MSSRDPKRRRSLSQEERALWTAVTQSIMPLREGGPGEADADEPAPVATRPKKRGQENLHQPAQTKASQPPPSPSLMPLGRRMRARVARGKTAIDARLDLHGFTQSEAHAALLHFVRSNSMRGARLVLVITGKGSGNRNQAEESGRGVLRRQVPHWLRLPEFRAYVMGFEDAHLAHGGEGAIYVRLRKLRED